MGLFHMYARRTFNVVMCVTSSNYKSLQRTGRDNLVDMSRLYQDSAMLHSQFWHSILDLRHLRRRPARSNFHLFPLCVTP